MSMEQAPEIHWVNVRVRPLPGFELADVRKYTELVGMEHFPTHGNLLTGRIPEDCLAALKAAPGVGQVEAIEPNQGDEARNG